MRIAVIGAGVVGVTTAWELVADGHDVTVYERSAGVAAETSFANAGVIAPGYVTPWAAPGMPKKVLKHLFSAHAPVRFAGVPGPALLGWMARWWRACEPGAYARHRAALLRLARYSRERLHALVAEESIDHERSEGVLVLLRGPADVALARPGLSLLAETGLRFHLVDARRCHEIEPGLNGETPLQAGIHLPDDEVGNCRQFTHLLKARAQHRGVRFKFLAEVLAVHAGPKPRLRSRLGTPAGSIPSAAAAPEEIEEAYDAIVVCAAVGSRALLRPLGVRLPIVAVHGYSITAPLRRYEAHPDVGPRSALIDERYKVAISRLGQRLRVAGVAELGGRTADADERAYSTLYRALDDWFPGAAQLSGVQRWKGARPMLPDGPPLIGATRVDGIWLNTGHGSSGWALACGSARLLADGVAGRVSAIEAADYDPGRLR